MNKLIEWEENNIDHLISIFNTREVPLRYVVSKGYMGNVADMTREEEILHHTILNGLMFDQYSKNLMHLIKEMAIITPAENIIRQVK